MKEYELASEVRLKEDEPCIMRLDGHCFSKWTKGFNKPFDTACPFENETTSLRVCFIIFLTVLRII
jgi:tRNA(His) 5'-end guanylyltransferase